jgi:tRNA-Thr(GGU) m(6)t(6)A37 methyltransferase TsaA
MISNMLLTPVARIHTPYSQKFGILRQGAGLSIAKGTIVFADHINAVEALSGIEQFSHLWLLFQFHQNTAQGWSAKVRPPRLGGNQKIGVFATRSSFRPNGIGMSVVKLLKVANNKLLVEGVDMLSGTPILDIKPYLAYADSLPESVGGYAHQSPPPTLLVHFEDEAATQMQLLSREYEDLDDLVTATLASDPRPAYKKNKSDEKQYHVCLYDIDICFSVMHNIAHIHSLKRINIE